MRRDGREVEGARLEIEWAVMSGPVSSNLTLSARHSDYAERWLSWSKALDWKSSRRAITCLEGSNPSLSAILYLCQLISELVVLGGEVAVPCTRNPLQRG